MVDIQKSNAMITDLIDHRPVHTAGFGCSSIDHRPAHTTGFGCSSIIDMALKFQFH